MSRRDKSFSLLNVAKTKDRSIDFRKSSTAATMIVVKGEEIELVEQLKYVLFWTRSRVLKIC